MQWCARPDFCAGILAVALLPAELSTVCDTLRLRAVAADVVGVLRAAGIDSIMLKGPVIAAWLYAGEVRPWSDVDILVSPAQFDRAMSVLGSVGFRPRVAGGARCESADNACDLIGP